MDEFTTHTGIGVPLRRSNVDTDQIIPAVYLKRVTRTGFEDGLFAAWRNDPSFVLNHPAYAGGLGARRRTRLRHRLVARARRVGPAELRLQGRHLPALRRHLPRQLRQGRTARRAGRREGRAAALGPPRRPARSDASPSTSRPAPSGRRRAPTRSRTPSTSTTTPAGGCSRASTTSASRSATTTTSRPTRPRVRAGSPSTAPTDVSSRVGTTVRRRENPRGTRRIPSHTGDSRRGREMSPLSSPEAQRRAIVDGFRSTAEKRRVTAAWRL